MIFAITPKFFLKQNRDFIYLESKQFQGSLFDAKIALAYSIWKYLGLGLAYNMFLINAEANRNDSEGIDMKAKIAFTFSGIMLYAKPMF